MTKDEMIKQIESAQQKLKFTVNKLKQTEKYDFIQMIELKRVIESLSEALSSPVQYPENERLDRNRS